MKQNKFNKSIIAFVIFCMLAIYGFVPPLKVAQAVDTIANAADLISDSDVNVVATHTFTFVTGTTTPAGGDWLITFPSTGFSGATSTNTTCGYGKANIVESGTAGTQAIECNMTADEAATTTQVVVTGVTSTTTAASYYITIENRDASANVLERVTVAVAVIDDVLMTATVDSSLTFSIKGTTTAAKVNGIPCSNASTATTTPFGTLTVNATSTVCQELEVTTNADDGYTVTVEQSDELTSDAGSNINSFNNSQDDTGSTTAEAWVAPTNVLDDYHTYGHMGLTSDDTDLSSLGGYNDFYHSGDAWFAGLNSTDPMPVLHHDGPSDGVAQDKGTGMVLYQVQVASLQEAGDYETTLTYICTPTF